MGTSRRLVVLLLLGLGIAACDANLAADDESAAGTSSGKADSSSGRRLPGEFESVREVIVGKQWDTLIAALASADTKVTVLAEPQSADFVAASLSSQGLLA